VSSLKNVSYDLRVNTTFIPKTPNYQSETPRAKWRRQFWQKTTPWAEDRRTYGGQNFYNTTLKPSSRNHVDIAGQWSFQDKSRSVTAESVDIDDIIALLVRKIEQHNSSAFELSRTFKFFDKNHSQTIDVEELASVLKSFALELSSSQIEAILDRFEAKVCSTNLLDRFKIRQTQPLFCLRTGVTGKGGSSPIQTSSMPSSK
jgi:hypothetical protein